MLVRYLRVRGADFSSELERNLMPDSFICPTTNHPSGRTFTATGGTHDFASLQFHSSQVFLQRRKGVWGANSLIDSVRIEPKVTEYKSRLLLTMSLEAEHAKRRYICFGASVSHNLQKQQRLQDKERERGYIECIKKFVLKKGPSMSTLHLDFPNSFLFFQLVCSETKQNTCPQL
ncbi:hypothetical protein D5086_010528 [Populus alba]|uniref:Uncharacterized protein n=1 Tax=Populus alba TaxID=43335 RepID=A0ACC4CB44_POPAL